MLSKHDVDCREQIVRRLRQGVVRVGRSRGVGSGRGGDVLGVDALSKAAPAVEPIENRVGPKPFRCRRSPGVARVARPTMLIASGDSRQVQSIAMDVSDRVDDVDLARDQPRGEAVPEEMAHAIMSAVDGLREHPAAQLHELRDVSARALCEQVEVVGHEAEAVQLDPVTLSCERRAPEELFSVVVVAKDP